MRVTQLLKSRIRNGPKLCFVAADSFLAARPIRLIGNQFGAVGIDAIAHGPSHRFQGQ